MPCGGFPGCAGNGARRRRPADLQRFEATRFSQNGEDGILAEVLRRLDIAGGVAVEIGASDGAENCTRALVEDGWRAVWLEADPEAAARATATLAGRGSVVHAAVTAENAGGLLDGAGVPEEPEVLVIDVDGNDFYVLDAVLRRRRPRVVVVEYNALAGPSWWVQPYEPERNWDHTARHGAGLTALTWLCNRYGLSLVGCDSTGVNASLSQTTARPLSTSEALGTTTCRPRSAFRWAIPGGPGPQRHRSRQMRLRSALPADGSFVAAGPTFPWLSVAGPGTKPTGSASNARSRSQPDGLVTTGSRNAAGSRSQFAPAAALWLCCG